MSWRFSFFFQTFWVEDLGIWFFSLIFFDSTGPTWDRQLGPGSPDFCFRWSRGVSGSRSISRSRESSANRRESLMRRWKSCQSILNAKCWHWLVVSPFFFWEFSPLPTWGKDSNLTSIFFQRGWNHQQVNVDWRAKVNLHKYVITWLVRDASFLSSRLQQVFLTTFLCPIACLKLKALSQYTATASSAVQWDWLKYSQRFIYRFDAFSVLSHNGWALWANVYMVSILFRSSGIENWCCFFWSSSLHWRRMTLDATLSGFPETG